MDFSKFNKVVLFGGSGYIGSYIINYLASNYPDVFIVIADIKEPRLECYEYSAVQLKSAGKIKYYYCDVRESIDFESDDSIDCIFNLAAVHREPGHEAREYFETNIKGAENITNFCKTREINNIIFTSSIAPYGHSEMARTEDSQVVPYSPYGSSKLVAEKIHQTWCDEHSDTRSLLIVRPGVIYGPNEDGNVPRLIKSVLKGYFFYCGNKHTRKAGGYVKELVNTIFFVADYLNRSKDYKMLYNFSFAPPPSVEEYVLSIKKVGDSNKPTFEVPYPIIYSASVLISFLYRLVGRESPIHPLRVRKLKINNTIEPEVLRKLDYKFKYDLISAFKDWKKDSPKDWFS